MTKIKFYLSNNEILGFEVVGHTGYKDSGEDVVCAGVSSAVSLVENCITDVLKLKAKIDVEEEKAKIFLKLPSEMNDSDRNVCRAVLDAFKMHMKYLQGEYPQYIKVMEE